MKKEIIYISGGQRSGKSSYAETLVKSMSSNPIYLATARCYDDEIRKRVKHHQNRRGEEWRTVEEETQLSKLSLEGEVVLMDCVTMWLTNIFLDHNSDGTKSLDFAKSEWDKFTAQDFQLVVVSNEIGMGVIPLGAETRSFVDMQGWMNQYIAQRADVAYAMISGLPLRLK